MKIGNRSWFTAEEIAQFAIEFDLPNFPRTARGVRMRAETWKKRNQKSGGGFEYHFLSFPIELQEKLGFLHIRQNYVSVETKTFQKLAIESFRYCLGRMTYAVGECCEFLKAHWKDLEPNIQAIILRELNEAIEFHTQQEKTAGIGRLGMECDYREWKELKTFIENQLKSKL